MKNYLILAALFILAGCVSVTQQSSVSTDDSVVNTTTPTSTQEQLSLPESAEVPILIYHHIREVRPTDSEHDRTFILSPTELERQFAYLHEQGFTPITFGNVVDYFSGTFELPERPVILSFDDGVVNQYANGFPLLKEYNFPATFFVFINPTGRSANYMNWEQLTELVEAGMEIGSHGYYHLFWDRISAAELEKELVESKLLLEANLDTPVRVAAYPFGEYNSQVTQAVKRAGYEAARDILNGKTHTSSTLFQLRGYFVTDNFSRFKNILMQ